MNILFVEDDEVNIIIFTKQLEKFGTVHSFKSSNGARRFLSTTDIVIDLVVCDHNILRFEEDSSRYKATGDEIYEEIRELLELSTPFVHFSMEPCPDKYYGSKDDSNFYSLRKQSHVDLSPLISKILSK